MILYTWLAGSSSSGLTTAAPPHPGISVDAADIAVVVVYFVFVMVVGIWVNGSTHFTLTPSPLFFIISLKYLKTYLRWTGVGDSLLNPSVLTAYLVKFHY